jgi:hypothetical protein
MKIPNYYYYDLYYEEQKKRTLNRDGKKNERIE